MEVVITREGTFEKRDLLEDLVRIDTAIAAEEKAKAKSAKEHSDRLTKMYAEQQTLLDKIGKANDNQLTLADVKKEPMITTEPPETGGMVVQFREDGSDDPNARMAARSKKKKAETVTRDEQNDVTRPIDTPPVPPVDPPKKNKHANTVTGTIPPKKKGGRK
jgi:hypothetical protein